MEKPDHKHCPYGHDHPQPVTVADGRELCLACLVRDELEVEMVDCDCGSDPDTSGLTDLQVLIGEQQIIIEAQGERIENMAQWAKTKGKT